MDNRWLAGTLALLASALQGQEPYVQTLSLPGGESAKAHGLSANARSESLVLGEVGYGWPMAILVSQGGEPQWTLVTDGAGALERALPEADGWVVAGAVDLWPHDYGGAFVVRLDGGGRLLWQLGVTDRRPPVRLAPAPEGGYFLSFNAGFRVPGAGPGVARVSASGKLVWMRVLAERLWQVHDLCSAPDGSLLVVGTASQDNRHTAFASLWDPQGQLRWSFRLPPESTLDACTFGLQDQWLLVGQRGYPDRQPDLWLATVDREGKLQAQKRVVGEQGLWGYAATAASGWWVAVKSGQVYGDAVLLELPWDLSGLLALAYGGAREVFPAGVAALPDGSTLWAGSETSLSSELFLVRSRGRLGDFWECQGLSQVRLEMTEAQERPEPLSLAFSSEEPYETSWYVTSRWGDLPERKVRCLGRSAPLPDLTLRGRASFDEELGAHAVVVSLTVTNQGEAPAPESLLRVRVASGSVIFGLPAGFSCQASETQKEAFCQLGELPPGAEVSLELTVVGNMAALRKGLASVQTSSLEKAYANNEVRFGTILLFSPRRVIKPGPRATAARP